MMPTHESSVNFKNLIKDLAEMYPFDVGIVVLVELVANCLDSNATCIRIDYDSKQAMLVISDNGKGMSASDFEQYHDFAAGLKTRGTGIGFAGVGAKISFNIACSVITETLSQSYRGGSNWYLASGKKLVWDEIPVVHLNDLGTRVELRFAKDVVLPFASTADILQILKQHYLPLFDRKFLALYEQMTIGKGHYSSSLRFIINGDLIEPTDIASDYSLERTHVFYPCRFKKKESRVNVLAMEFLVWRVAITPWGKVWLAYCCALGEK